MTLAPELTPESLTSERQRPPWAGKGFPERGDEEIAALHATYAVTRDRRLRDELLAHYDGLAVALARKLPSRRESLEDLIQVARIGLIHAVDRFDPDRGRPFVVFARATIAGELKRHLRDHTWTMRMPRSLHDNHLAVINTVDELTQQLGRSPRISEVAARCGLEDEKVLEAMEVSTPLSLNAFEGDGPGLNLGAVESGIERVEERALLARFVGALPERERQVLHLRFVDQLTQLEIAGQVGVSQMCISRMLARVLNRMRIKAQGPPVKTAEVAP